VAGSPKWQGAPSGREPHVRVKWQGAPRSSQVAGSPTFESKWQGAPRSSPSGREPHVRVQVAGSPTFESKWQGAPSTNDNEGLYPAPHHSGWLPESCYCLLTPCLRFPESLSFSIRRKKKSSHMGESRNLTSASLGLCSTKQLLVRFLDSLI
jgi:hypothetical protein